MRVLKVNKENTKNILSDLLKRSPNNYDQYAGIIAKLFAIIFFYFF